VNRIRELWETNHQVKDMLSVLQDEGFDVQERDVNRVRQKNGWLLRMDPAHFTKRRASQGPSRVEESDSQEDDDDGGDGEEEEEEGDGAPGLDSVMPDLPVDLDFAKAQAEAFQEERRRRLAVEAEELRATKKRRRWVKGRAGLPADPPGPPRFPSELSLTECKAVLSMDPAVYKDVREKFRRICEEEGVLKKTVAGPHKWEAIKLQLVRESMHLRGIFWDNLNIDQKNLALDLICCDITKAMRTQGSKMYLHEARNILGLNPTMSRAVRFHLHKILAEDHFAGKTLAGAEHWNELVQRWVNESPILQSISASMDINDPNYKQRKKAFEVVARDAMKRFRDADVERILSRGLEQDANDLDAHGETDHDAGRHGGAMDMSGFDTTFGEDESALLAAQLSMAPVDEHGQPAYPAISTNSQGQAATPATGKRKRGRPRKLPYPDNPPETAPADDSGTPAKKRRGRQSKRIPQEEALRIYAHSQARFLPPDATSGRETSGSTEPSAGSPLVTNSSGQRGIIEQQPQLDVHQYNPEPVPAPAPAPAPSPGQAHAATVRARARAQAQAQLQARARAQEQTQLPAPAAALAPPAQRTPTAIYFRLQPTSTVSGVPSMWVATLLSRSVEELRSKAVAKSPGAVCLAIDGIVKDGMGGEMPLPIRGDEELEAYLDHILELHAPPTFSVQLISGS
jgi:hypothetical protein